MRPVQIYHEAPLSIYDKVQAVTDGDYALVHLLDQDERYAEKFLETAADIDRPLILDNSVFELGKAYDTDAYLEWIDLLVPDIYVGPEVVSDAEGTVDLFDQWMLTHHNELPGDIMGVVQGKTPGEIVNCFKRLKNAGADVIGIPIMLGASLFGGPIGPMELMAGRIAILDLLHNECEAHPIHLLGCALPQEGVHVSRFPWIESVDTSNPVVHGLFDIRYTSIGLTEKRSELLATLIHHQVTAEQETTIMYNIGEFKKLWSR